MLESMNSFTDFLDANIYQWSLDIIIALTVLVLFWIAYLITQKPLRHLLSSQHVDDYLVTILIGSIYKSILVITAIITALSQLGINVIAAMTGFGIAGIAIGFAAKDTLGNIIAGFMILWDKPFLMGDWLEVDGQYGQVQGITLRSTRIKTNNNFHIVVPNQTIINSTLVNHHQKRKVRKIVYFTLPYTSDIEHAIEVLKETASNHPKALQDPAPGSGIGSFENGMVHIAVLFWVKNAKTAVGAGSWIGWSLFQNVNLTFHEAGHTLFLWAPKNVMLFMGSGFEVLLPLCITLYFAKTKNKPGTVFGLWWTGTALWSAGVYVGDAVKRQLNLIGGMDPVYHDWFNLMLDWGLLYSAETIGANVYFLGSTCVVISISWLVHMIYNKTIVQ